MTVAILRIFAFIATAMICGRLVAKVRLPAILGWLLAGILFGPHLAGVVTAEITESLWYQVGVKTFEAIAGVMIGREILLKKLAASGKQLMGITFIQSIGTFIVVSTVFALFLSLSGLPVYLAFLFGGIALATAPAPALSIVNEYHTKGPVTDTLIPLAVVDDVIGVAVFFTVISIVQGFFGGQHMSPFAVVGMVLFPFLIGIIGGFLAAWIIRPICHVKAYFAVFLIFLMLSAAAGFAVDALFYHSFSLNDLLIGMAYSATVVNLISKEKMEQIMKLYNPLLNLSLVCVVGNLGMPLDYRLMAGAGLFTLIYILARAVGKIGGAYLGGKLTGTVSTVTNYLGFTLLPHSGVSLVFTGIAVTTLNRFDPASASVISGTIVAAAIINEIIAVVLAKFAFEWAGEIPKKD